MGPRNGEVAKPQRSSVRMTDVVVSTYAPHDRVWCAISVTTADPAAFDDERAQRLSRWARPPSLDLACQHSRFSSCSGGELRRATTFEMSSLGGPRPGGFDPHPLEAHALSESSSHFDLRHGRRIDSVFWEVPTEHGPFGRHDIDGHVRHRSGHEHD